VEALRKLGGIYQQQVVQPALDRQLVRVVPAPGWTESRGERIRRLVEEYCSADVRVEVEIRPRLELPASGKLLEVVSEL
jgi:hypothetical protein